MFAETTAKPNQPVPALWPAKTIMGTCHKAQITPERTAVAVNEKRLGQLRPEESTPTDFLA
jgi:hypothetical protein